MRTVATSRCTTRPTGSGADRPAFPNGADGLVSTVDDLAAFGTMMLDEGRSPAGAPVLARETLRAMTTARMPIGEDGGPAGVSASAWT